MQRGRGGRLTSECVIGHTKKGERVGSEYMEDVMILGEAKPGLGLRRQLLQNPADNGSGVTRHSAELRQHRHAPGNQSVQNRH